MTYLVGTVNISDPMSRREAEKEGTKVSATTVVCDSSKLRIAMTPTEELKLVEMEDWLVVTVILAVALERLNGYMYISRAGGG